VANLLRRELSRDTVAVRPRLDDVAAVILEALRLGLNAEGGNAGDQMLAGLRSP
jgi:hypothetical protein